jgi:hypothetical protein
MGEVERVFHQVRRVAVQLGRTREQCVSSVERALVRALRSPPSTKGRIRSAENGEENGTRTPKDVGRAESTSSCCGASFGGRRLTRSVGLAGRETCSLVKGGLLTPIRTSIWRRCGNPADFNNVKTARASSELWTLSYERNGLQNSRFPNAAESRPRRWAAYAYSSKD